MKVVFMGASKVSWSDPRVFTCADDPGWILLVVSDRAYRLKEGRVGAPVGDRYDYTLHVIYVIGGRTLIIYPKNSGRVSTWNGAPLEEERASSFVIEAVRLQGQSQSDGCRLRRR